MKNRKRKDFGLPMLLGIGTLFSLVTVVFTSLLLAIISYFTKNPTSLVGAFSLASLIIAGGVSAFVTARVNGDGGVPLGILSAVASSLVILTVGLIITKGSLPFSAILNVLAFLSSSLLAAAVGGRKRKKSYYKR